MLRKLTNFFHKEIFRLSSQHTKVLPFANSTNDGSALNAKERSPILVKKPLGKKAGSNFERLKSFIDLYQKNFYKGAQTHDAKEDFVVWCTGVLTISSAIVGHKWFKNGENQNCPLHDISAVTLKNILLEPFSRSHAVLAINADPKQNAESKGKSNSASKKAKLEDLFEKYESSTQECNGTFLNELGVKYGRTNNHKEAFAMFKEASTFGNSAAMFNMALSYEKGIGINRSYIDAANCYKKAGDVGHAKALFNLSSLHYAGLLGNDKVKDGFEFAKKAADHGLCKAQLFVALQYTKEEDWKNAFKYFKMAAEQKDITSMYNLAVCYEYGYGTDKNISEGLKLFHESASEGHSLAQYHLGQYYQISNNLEEALHWFQLAAKNGHPKAQAKVEYVEYEIAQKNEDDLLTMFESNTLLQVLEPIKSVIRSPTFHKSSSMPSLQKLYDNTNSLQPYLLKKTSLNRSTYSLYL